MKTIHRQLYVAHGIELEEPIILPGNRFSLLCMTGEWDEERKIWVGIVGEMLDPQKTKNKSLSAALHFYLTNAKGGLLFETGAFVNEPMAKEQWSRPDAWIPTNEGALREGKIAPRKPVEMPASLHAFFEIGTRSVTDIIGVSQEFLGLGQSEMSDPTQRNRVASGLAILGWIFDEFDRFKKQDSNVTLEFVRDFMTDGQLIEIGGGAAVRSIPLLKSNLPLKYRLQLDQSIRQNPNLKAQIWRDLMPIVPALLRFGAAHVLVKLLRFSPLPAQVVREIQRGVAEQPPQDQQRGRGKQEPPQLVAAKVKKAVAEAEKAEAQARALDQESQARIAELFLQGFRLTSEMAQREESDEYDRGKDAEKIRQEREKLDLERHKWAVEVMKVLSAMMPESRGEVRE
ncbi:MAG: hypothetical protein ACE5JO_04620 [Candidatus Binatia bacterium]